MTRASDLWGPIQAYITNELNSRCLSGVHHYTSVASALGILKDERIWFTERAHLNDQSEILHGITIAKKILHERNMTDVERRFSDAAQRVFRDFRFFSASFSSKRDDRHQWRNYADHGKGVALSFKASCFEDPQAHFKKFFQGNLSVVFCPMSYDSCKLREVIGSIIDAWDEQNIDELCDHVFMISSMFKEKTWDKENEYRFFVHGKGDSLLKISSVNSGNAMVRLFAT